MKRLLIKNAKILDFDKKKEVLTDILVEGERIVEIAKNISNGNAEVLDIEEKYLFPGLVDAHAHLREPGEEYKEDIASGSRAALHGGVTTVFAMPNTKPALDSRAMIEFVIERAKKAGYSEVLPVGAITKGRKGEELAEIGDMREGGAIAFSDDGSWVRNSSVMRRALEYSIAFDTVIISHAEDSSLSRGVVHESVMSYDMGLEGYPSAQEEIAVFRDVKLAELTGGRLHIAHVSSRGSLEIIRGAKEKGVNVTCEVTPNHLLLAQEEIDLFNPLYKINPPIRTRDDREALVEGLKEGAIDIIATDHAPHNWYEKETDFNSAPSGMISLDFYFSLLYSELVNKGKISIYDLVAATTYKPAKIFGLSHRGRIEKGYIANLVVFDPVKEFVISEDFIRSRSKNTPFLGKRVRGGFVKVIKKGVVLDIEEI